MLIISFLWVLLLNMRVGKSLMDEAMLDLKVSKEHHKISAFCKDKRYLLFTSMVSQNSIQGPRTFSDGYGKDPQKLRNEV